MFKRTAFTYGIFESSSAMRYEAAKSAAKESRKFSAGCETDLNSGDSVSCSGLWIKNIPKLTAATLFAALIIR